MSHNRVSHNNVHKKYTNTKIKINIIVNYILLLK